jgi:hypothetical protein
MSTAQSVDPSGQDKPLSPTMHFESCTENGEENTGICDGLDVGGLHVCAF